jgi:hypothetical protein
MASTSSGKDIFVSYAREDAALAREITDYLYTGTRLGIWFDEHLTGGQAWWDEILASIRACHLFVFLISDSSLRSEACLRELTYARRLDRQLLPVTVNMSDAPSFGPLADVQVLTYESGNALRVADLVGTASRLHSDRPLPTPVPHPPRRPDIVDTGVLPRIFVAGSDSDGALEPFSTALGHALASIHR